MSNLKGVIVVCGNDGTGKSSVVKAFNQKCRDYVAIERSDGCEHYGIVASALDEMTLVERFNSSETILKESQFVGCAPVNNQMIPVFWVILDANLETIAGRIKNRPISDKWEKPKSLAYFRARFREISGFFGFPLIETDYINIEEVAEQIYRTCCLNNGWYQELQQMAISQMTHQLIMETDIENVLISQIVDPAENEIKMSDFLDSLWLNHPYYSQLAGLLNQSDVNKIFMRFLIRNNLLELYSENNCHSFPSKKLEKFAEYLDLSRLESENYDQSVKYFTSTRPLLQLIVEGESKRIYKILTQNPYLREKVIIVLKSTIYSHSMQSSGEIADLGSIRGAGTQIFMEMMYRNNLDHSYVAVGNQGIILSEYVSNISPIEIVVKKYCEGTDKHSFYGMADSSHSCIDPNNKLILPSGEYVNGPYVRFDWRNPNHIDKATNRSVSENPYYYLFESAVGKDRFFSEFLHPSRGLVTPMGDKTVPEILIRNTIDVPASKSLVLKMFFTIQSYFNHVGLEIKDVCFMLDAQGKFFWSEINQDCMRIKTQHIASALSSVVGSGLAGSAGVVQQFDKDLWRAGGSSSKTVITQKWLEFNQVMRNYFRTHPFLTSEMPEFNAFHYESVMNGVLNNKSLRIPPPLVSNYPINRSRHGQRRVIVTMDLHDQKPVLVKSGSVYTTHSNGDYRQAMEKISIFPDILVVDLNGAFGNTKSPNRAIINSLAPEYYIHTGGGLRTLEDIQDVLQNSVRRVVLSSVSDQILAQVPSERLIVELSVDQDNIVLTHGRSVNTGLKLIDRIRALIALGTGIDTLSITFHQTEGHLAGIPRQQITQLMTVLPNQIRKVIIAGGIASIDDLNFLWSFDKIVPQLGSAIWSNRISIADIYNAMVNFCSVGNCDELLVPMIIQDVNGLNKGLVYGNRESIALTCHTRMLHRYSRKDRCVYSKGDGLGLGSENFQRVLKMSADCDSDCLLVTVDSANCFCHTGNYSCFSLQTSIKANLNTLTQHVKSKMGTNSYTGKMQNNPELALGKLMEEFWEIVTAYKENRVGECSDLLIHLLMYLNGTGISIESILNELNARRWDPHLVPVKKSTYITSSSSGSSGSSCGTNEVTGGVASGGDVILAITSSKYSDKTLGYLENFLGIKAEYGAGRSLKVTYQIVDHSKYDQFFPKDKKLRIVTSRPKDMSAQLATGRIDFAVTYETVVGNQPKTYWTIHEDVDPTICLALIKKADVEIDVSSWSCGRKVLIAAEHVCHVASFMQEMGVKQDAYHLDHVMGSSEGFLVSMDKYLLCDAIVESGQTLIDNDLQIWKTIIPKGSVKIGLYGRP